MIKLKKVYKGVKPKKKYKLEYDKKSKGRPAWIKIKDLPEGINFIYIFLGKEGRGGRRIQFYKTYLPPGLFVPIDYTKKEMKLFYDKFSEFYDQDLIMNSSNLQAARFLLRKLKKYAKKNSSLLDLGAGTGLVTEVFIKGGFNDITLVDSSKKMLDKARKKPKLKSCNFVQSDIRKLKLKRKFDVVLSVFSLGSSSYFDEDEIGKILDKVKGYLKKGGVIIVMGHFGTLFEKKFKKLESGIYTLGLDKKRKFYTDYFIGRKK